MSVPPVQNQLVGHPRDGERGGGGPGQRNPSMGELGRPWVGRNDNKNHQVTVSGALGWVVVEGGSARVAQSPPRAPGRKDRHTSHSTGGLRGGGGAGFAVPVLHHKVAHLPLCHGRLDVRRGGSRRDAVSWRVH